MQTYNSSAFPPLGPYGQDANSLKYEHDAYDVYVNHEYVGKKLLLTQTEDLGDIVDFLKQQGIHNITAQLDGDHYMITCDDSDHAKQIIEMHINNR